MQHCSWNYFSLETIKYTKRHVLPSKTSQSAHSRSLVRCFVIRMKKCDFPYGGAGDDWLDCSEVQAYLDLHWAHIFYASADFEFGRLSKMTVRPAKTQISLGIRPVWSESSQCAQWVAKDSTFLHADSESSLGAKLILLVLSWGGSIHFTGYRSQPKKQSHRLSLYLLRWGSRTRKDLSPYRHKLVKHYIGQLTFHVSL